MADQSQCCVISRNCLVYCYTNLYIADITTYHRLSDLNCSSGDQKSQFTGSLPGLQMATFALRPSMAFPYYIDRTCQEGSLISLLVMTLILEDESCIILISFNFNYFLIPNAATLRLGKPSPWILEDTNIQYLTEWFSFWSWMISFHRCTEENLAKYSRTPLYIQGFYLCGSLSPAVSSGNSYSNSVIPLGSPWIHPPHTAGWNQPLGCKLGQSLVLFSLIYLENHMSI